MIFGGSQILMDVEPLVRMVRGDAVLHGLSHTIAGAFVIGVVAALIGRPVCNALLARSSIGDLRIRSSVAWISAFIGTYSHVGLDAIMHADMNPFWPVAHGNQLLGVVSVVMLHALCVVSGLLGCGLVAVRALRDT